jgi:aryl-alcohol dehydrogenase-like predicted oxidoreductase
MIDPTRTALGTWSGGAYMKFGAAIERDRLLKILRPDEQIQTLMTADAYGMGAGDELAGEAIAGLPRDGYCLVGAIGHDFYEGERAGAKGFPRFTDPALRGKDAYADYIRMATERSLERVGVDQFDLLLLHNPDRTGYTSEAVWNGMAAVRDAGLTRKLGVAPGPANGFTLDLIECFERFGSEIDWSMVILNPFEPWPGELVLPAAVKHEVELITRVVDYGGLFHDDVRPGHTFPEHDHRAFRPKGWIERGNERLDRVRPIAERHEITMLQLASLWNLSHEPVKCVAPTLIEEIDGGKSIEDKRAELAALSATDDVLCSMEITEIREIGENIGSMKLKGGSPDNDGDVLADSWPLSDDLKAIAERWSIEPQKQLSHTLD